MVITLYQGDCLAALQTVPDASISSIVCDPPYGLSEQTQDDIVHCLTAWLAGKPYIHGKAGMMQKSWDSFVPGPEIWREAYRVLKPGGHLLAFAGTRTIDLMGLSIRLAGFEIRDSFAWLYAQGMPHGTNIGKSAEKKLPGSPQAARLQGWHSGLRPSFEPLVMARRPLDGTVLHNSLQHGVGGLNIDACRLPIDPAIDDPRLGGKGTWGTGAMAKNVYGEFAGERVGSSAEGRFAPNVAHDGSEPVMEYFASFGEKKADAGSVARFFYEGKISAKERGSSKHPTQKPVALMRYLIRMVTPEGGTVLDPFAGSGTTGEAAVDEGFDAILIEREGEYADHIRQRLNLFLTNDITID